MNSYQFDFTKLTPKDLTQAWTLHQRLREQLTTDDIVTIVKMAIKYGENMESVPLLQFADVILAFYRALADYLDTMIEP